MLFFVIFGFWGRISPWSRLGRATKFYMKEIALIRNFHNKFEGIPTIFLVTVKKTFIFHFRGPFWALLGTPWKPHHHESYFSSLLHHDAPPTFNLSCWDLFQYQTFSGNSQKWPFLAFFRFTTSLQMVISQLFLGNMEWNLIWNL
jgi:hypothetical protein